MPYGTNIGEACAPGRDRIPKFRKFLIFIKFRGLTKNTKNHRFLFFGAPTNISVHRILSKDHLIKKLVGKKLPDVA